MKTLRTDLGCYSRMAEGHLDGLSANCVDDMLRTGTVEFHKLCALTRKRLEMANDQNVPFRSTGFLISKDPTNTLQLDQVEYARQLRLLPDDCNFSAFASVSMNLMWLSHTRPNCMFEILKLTQITRDYFTEERETIIKNTNRAIKYSTDQAVRIRLPNLQKNTINVVGCSDASFASNLDHTSQLGYILFLADASSNFVPIIYKSYKARCVTTSVPAAELIAFSNLFDASYTLTKELEKLLGRRKVAVQLLTNSKSLFDIISKGSRTSEKRVMLDIARARQGYRNFEIDDIGFVRSGDNIADGLTEKRSKAVY